MSRHGVLVAEEAQGARERQTSVAAAAAADDDAVKISTRRRQRDRCVEAKERQLKAGQACPA